MKTLYRQFALVALLASAAVVRAQDPAAAQAATEAATAGDDSAKRGYVLGYKVSEQIKQRQADLDYESFVEGFKAGMQGAGDAKKASYGTGLMVSREFKEGGLELDTDEFAKGVSDCLNGSPIKFSEADQKAILDKMRIDSQQRELVKRNQKAAENLAIANKFLEENKTKDGVKTTASGLQYKIVKSGDAAGKSPIKSDTVKVNYRGTLINGTEFDSSEKNGGPIEFGVGQVIPGWTEALQLMKPGDKWQLFIPPAIAYGEGGSPPRIEPNSALIFDVELLSIQGADAGVSAPN